MTARRRRLWVQRLMDSSDPYNCRQCFRISLNGAQDLLSEDTGRIAQAIRKLRTAANNGPKMNRQKMRREECLDTEYMALQCELDACVAGDTIQASPCRPDRQERQLL